MFAQMEGYKKHENHENGVPEAQKCCGGSKFMLAAFESACPRISVEGNILQPEMAPKWYQHEASTVIVDGSMFEANFEAMFFNSGFPSPPPRGRGPLQGRATTGEVK